MPLRRAVAPLAPLLLLALVPLPGATAAAASCRAATDPRGDAPAAYDITALDVAAGKKTVVGELRLAGPPDFDSPPVFGRSELALSFRVRGVEHTFRYVADGGRSEATFETPEGTSRLDWVSVKVTATSVRWTVPKAAVRALRRPAPLCEKSAATYATPLRLTMDTAGR
jgi:hypothetical protein